MQEGQLRNILIDMTTILPDLSNELNSSPYLLSQSQNMSFNINTINVNKNDSLLEYPPSYLLDESQIYTEDCSNMRTIFSAFY